MKRILFFLMLLTTFGIVPVSGSAQNNDIISKFNCLERQKLLDTAHFYYNKNSIDTALICYGLIINTPVKESDTGQQKENVKALNNSAILHSNICDYRRAYELYIRALLLCEKYTFVSEQQGIYVNMGNIYGRFKQYDRAISYYSKALNLHGDSTRIALILNNLEAIELEKGKFDSAFYFLSQSLQISKRYNSIYLYNILSNMAEFYQKEEQYDSAYYYYQLSLDEAKKNRPLRKLI